MISWVLNESKLPLISRLFRPDHWTGLELIWYLSIIYRSSFQSPAFWHPLALPLFWVFRFLFVTFSLFFVGYPSQKGKTAATRAHGH